MSKNLDELDDKINQLAIDSERHANNVDNLKDNFEKIDTKVDNLSGKIDDNKEEIILAVKAEFVKYVEFEPVKTIVYSMVGAVLVSVLIAVLALVIVPRLDQSPLAPVAKLAPGVEIGR